jgi:hypothetical protein
VSEKEREWSAKHRELQAKMTRELEDSRRQMEAEVARTERYVRRLSTCGKRVCLERI